MVADSPSGGLYCPTFRPTRSEFSKPFCDYVSKIFKEQPGLAMFKVIPPKGWSPRTKPFPNLSKINIDCPIKQLVFGTRGCYRCMLIEQKPLSASEFRKIAEDNEHRPQTNNQRGEPDEIMERAFWSSVTINPPLYGADTPQSFFEDNLPWGWNLRNLGCLLKTSDVPSIPGVTSPMTYFGMWKSFFSWHLEDRDLYSINYMHFGAPKVWYCVSPADKPRFDRMVQSIFPELHKQCKSFMRHKDVMLSPAQLRSFNVPYTMAKQEAGEFIVLNAAAYHAGYNMGFNCAEAVNFAMEQWLQAGRHSGNCHCGVLKDCVQIDMRIFGLSSDSEFGSSSEEESSSSEDSSDDEQGSSSEEEEVAGKGKGSSSRAAAGSKRKAPSKAAVATPTKRAKTSTSTPALKAGKQVSTPKPAAKGKPASKPAAAKQSPAAAASSRAATPLKTPTKAPSSSSRAAAKSPAPRSTSTKDLERQLRKPLVQAEPGSPRQTPAAGAQPCAVVGEDEAGARYFHLVRKTQAQASARGLAVLQWLQEGKDGLFRPSGQSWEERPSSLVPVRTVWVEGRGRRGGGYRLMTLRKKILDTELVD